jgi:ELWxxDGT repeat protein
VLFFTADDGTVGRELWRSDGTKAGTVLLKDINPTDEYSGSSGIRFLTNVAGTAFFSAVTDGTDNTRELWKSDGTGDGTVQVKEINPNGGSAPFDLTSFMGTLFFQAGDGSHGYELWKSDGTEDGTVLVKDIYPTGSSYPMRFTKVGSLLYFRANDGVNGAELWSTDGTGDGTELVGDINPTGGSEPHYLANVAGTLFFAADDGTNGIELWKYSP